MITVDVDALLERMNPSCRQAMESAAALCMGQGAEEVSVSHWLHALLGQPGTDLPLILAAYGIDAEEARRALALSFYPGDVPGAHPVPALSPLLVELMADAWTIGSVELGLPAVRGGSILLGVLARISRYLSPMAASLFGRIGRDDLRLRFLDLLAISPEHDAGSIAPPRHTDDGLLARYTADLTQQAADGRIDPVLCRDADIDRMIDILLRRTKNHPIVVGEAGVGKSALVEGLALRIIAGKVPASLTDVRLLALDIGALQAGASVRGEFEKRLKGLIDEIKASSRQVILFMDEAHALIGAGNAAGGSDAANLLKPALARGGLRTIAATTWSEYRRYFEKDPALSRRFQPVVLDEPSLEAATDILRGLRAVYEAAHGVHIGDDAIRAAVAWSARYLSGRQLPDKAVDVLDTACAQVAAARMRPPPRLSRLEDRRRRIEQEIDHLKRDLRIGRRVDTARVDTLCSDQARVDDEIARLDQAWRAQQVLVGDILACRVTAAVDSPPDAVRLTQLGELYADEVLVPLDVGEAEIARVIADWTGIPAGTLGRDPVERLERLPSLLRARVKGQDAAIDLLHRRLLTAMADLRRPGTPIGAFLLVGPSGVGKTETALALADLLFGGPAFLTALNLSEYQEKHTVSRLLGAPPGYVGYGEGGVLTEAIRKRPYAVVLLDEVEKAHPDVLNVLYQVFDKGELADGEGRRIDCRNVLFVLTSNLGFDRPESLADHDEDVLRLDLGRFFKPALLARMQVVPYRYLDEDVLGEIVIARMLQLRERFDSRYGAPLHIDDTALDELRRRCVRHADGARRLDASIESDLLPPLSLAVLRHVATGERCLSARVGWSGDVFTAIVE